MTVGFPESSSAMVYWSGGMEDNVTMKGLITVSDSNATQAGVTETRPPSWDLEPQTNWGVLGFVVLVVVAILCNCVIGVTVQQSPRLHSMFYYLLSSLAFSDILNAIFVLPIAVAKTLLDDFPLSPVFCQVWHTLLNTFAASSLAHMLLATVHSHLMLSIPLQYRQCSRVSSILLQFSAVWLIPVLLAVPTVVMFAMRRFDTTETLLWGCGPLSATYVLVSLLPSFYLPLIVMVVVYIKATVKVKQQNKIAIKLQHEVLSNGNAHGTKPDINNIEAGNVKNCHHKVSENSIKDKTNMLIAVITKNDAKDKRELLGNDSPDIKLDRCISVVSDTISDCSMTTYNMSEVDSSMDDPECHSIGTDNATIPVTIHCDPTEPSPLDQGVAVLPKSNDGNDQPETADVETLSTDENHHTDKNVEIQGENPEEDGKVKVEEDAGNAVVQVKAKAGKEQLNAPVDNNDIALHVSLDSAGLLDTDKLLQGLDNPAYNSLEENPLAESIKPKKVKEGSSHDNEAEKSEKSLSSETLGHSRNSSLEHCGIDGPHRSILRRDGSKRQSRKNVKFDLPEGGKAEKKGKGIQRRPTGIRRDSRGKNNSTQKQKLHRLSSHLPNATAVNGKVTNIAKLHASTKGFHYQNGSVKSSTFEYMAQVHRDQGLRLSSKVRSQKANIQLLCVMLTAFLVLSLPYFITHTVLSMCQSCRSNISTTMVVVFEWLFHAASAINLFIYMACSSEFRTAFLVMLGCK